MSALDLSGQRFGRLLCLSMAGRSPSRCLVWLCQCDCGGLTEVPSSRLLSDHTQSCGCLQRESASKSGQARRTHGALTDDSALLGAYRTWAHMKGRCANPNESSFHNYGARGVRVVDKWLTFEGFWEDMGPTYQPGLTLDRIDNNGHYEPENCRWASRRTQCNNKRTNHLLAFRGQKQTLSEWGMLLGLNPRTIQSRLRAGWSAEKALTAPARRKTRKEVRVADA